MRLTRYRLWARVSTSLGAFAVFVTSAFWVSASREPGAAARALPEVARRVETVGPGVTHVHEFHSSGPLNIHIVQVDLTTTGVSIAAGLGRGRLFTGAPVHEMARRYESPTRHVVAATNADFWKNMAGQLFVPVNLFVADGRTVRLPCAPAPRAVFGRTIDGKYFMRPVTAHLSILRNRSRLLDDVRLNDPISSCGAVLFTDAFGDSVALARFRAAYELELLGDRFLPNEPARARVVTKASATTSALGSRRFVLALHADAARKLAGLRVGTTLTLLLRVPEVRAPIDLAIGGAPLLLHEGKPFIDWQEEKVLRSFVTDRHPRTAVGLTRDQRRLVIVTVDGRQPATSIGMSLYELALYLRQLGCWQAMNFDGGGSTTMVVRGEVVNRPSDRFGARSVANALLVVSHGPAGPLASLEILPRSEPTRVPVGSKAQFAVRGRDAAGNEVALEASRLEWDCRPNTLGQLVRGGTTSTLCAAPFPGEGTVVASYTTTAGIKHSAKHRVEVVRIRNVVVEPVPIVLRRGETVDVSIRAESSSGPVELTPEMVRLHASNENLRVSGTRLYGMQRGKGALQVAIGDVTTTYPFYVDLVTTRIVCQFDEPVTASLMGAGFDRRATRVRLETERAKFGSGCLAWRYAMSRGGASRIVLPVDVPIPGKPLQLALWIYGDGQEAWLRGEVLDARGQPYLVDFTAGATGITWKGVWRQVIVPVRTLLPQSVTSGRTPVFPIRLTKLYLAQDQEALKAHGEILLDQLEAIYPPE